ncbi:MAG TPA: hypothetical protein VFX22_05905 [Candidatus Kapabacteria bacterium]|nr:hypothetical protein [Candidatus Kapabacteria bacterium]
MKPSINKKPGGKKVENSRSSQATNPLQNLLKRMDERWAKIPEEERAKIPIDGALNLDHYLYGAPKISE